MSQNAINTSYLASVSSTIHGSDQRELITPYTLEQKMALQRPNGSGSTANISIQVSSSQITIASASGAGLSTTAPAYASVVHQANGNQNTFKLDSGINLLSAASLLNSTFGTTAGVAWGSAMPLYVYVCIKTNGLVPVFGISRMPHLSVVPSGASASVGYPGSAAMTNDRGIYLFNTVVPADYYGGSCVCVGRVEATKNNLDQWSFVAASGYIGTPPQKLYDFPDSQATSGKFFDNNGGVAPTFTSNYYQYALSQDGLLNVRLNLDTRTGPAPSGAVNVKVTLPFYVRGMGSEFPQGLMRMRWNTTNNSVLQLVPSDGTLYKLVPPPTSASQATYVTDFGSIDQVVMACNYYLDLNVS